MLQDDVLAEASILSAVNRPRAMSHGKHDKNNGTQYAGFGGSNVIKPKKIVETNRVALVSEYASSLTPVAPRRDTRCGRRAGEGQEKRAVRWPKLKNFTRCDV